MGADASLDGWREGGDVVFVERGVGLLNYFRPNRTGVYHDLIIASAMDRAHCTNTSHRRARSLAYPVYWQCRTGGPLRIADRSRRKFKKRGPGAGAMDSRQRRVNDHIAKICELHNLVKAVQQRAKMISLGSRSTEPKEINLGTSSALLLLLAGLFGLM